MRLKDLTDKNAVLAAMSEFDDIGREAFLLKYGFRKSRAYYLFHQGTCYDSKAIVAAAHAIQFPTQGPLLPQKFCGGEATVAKQLRSLGFKVIHDNSVQRPLSVWAFSANPRRYDIEKAIESMVFDYWITGHSDIRSGDHAIIWQTTDSQGRRGIVALAEVLSDPAPLTDERNPFWQNHDDSTIVAPRVLIRYAVPPGLPIWVGQTAKGSFLKTLSVARATGGSVFKITDYQWRYLTSLLNYSSISPTEMEAQESLRPRSALTSGQGFGLTTAARKQVENYAVDRATSFFEKEGYTVTDVSANSRYDLLCERGDETLKVEVKGTVGLGKQIILTKNELEQTRHEGYVLFVVSEIVVDYSRPDDPLASAGKAVLFRDWRPSDKQLKPLSYICDVDFDKGLIVWDSNTTLES